MFNFWHGNWRPSASRSGSRKRSTVRLDVLQLEDRVLPTGTPGVNLTDHFAAMDWTVNSPQAFVPPDTIAAAGPDRIIETVNTAIAIYNNGKNGPVGSTIMAPMQTTSFFPGNIASATDASVTYNELLGEFFIGFIDEGSFNSFHYAVSTTSTPSGPGDFKFYTVNVSQLDPAGSNTYFADFPRVGWNANEFAVSFNMYNGKTYNHALILNISSADPNPITTPPTLVDMPGTITNATMIPAVMHGSSAANPMYWVEEKLDSTGNATGTAISIWTETDPLGSHNFTRYDIVFDTVGMAGADYTPINLPFGAAQKGTTNLIAVNDSGFLNAEWRDHHLVATQAVRVVNQTPTDAQAHARWYDFDTTLTEGPTPVPPKNFQFGTIGVNSGKNSYYPAIAIGYTDLLVLTYMESSSSEYMSMYVTGRLLSDTLDTMEAPKLVQGGVAPYKGFGRRSGDPSPYRAGDFSGISVDPSDGSFWAASEYAAATNSFGGNWGTAIGHFNLGNTLIEDFNGYQSYTLAFLPATFQIAPEASHELGLDYGLIDYPGNGWIYRTDAAAQVSVGTNISVWLQFNAGVDGQAAFLFGANSLANGYANATYALLVDASDTSNEKLILIEQGLSGSSSPASTILATTPGLFLQPNQWYRLEVDWTGSQSITGKIFDSNATSMILSVTATGFTSLFTSGGIGFHASGANPKYWDTVTDPPAMPDGATGPGAGDGHQHPGPSGDSMAAQILNSLIPLGPGTLFHAVDAVFASHEHKPAEHSDIAKLAHALQSSLAHDKTPEHDGETQSAGTDLPAVLETPLG
jgi:hypothetical protein